MHEDIHDILALEVKKEMADRYFGFRKLIEEDIREYDNQVLTSFLRLEQKIVLIWSAVHLTERRGSYP